MFVNRHNNNENGDGDGVQICRSNKNIKMIKSAQKSTNITLQQQIRDKHMKEPYVEYRPNNSLTCIASSNSLPRRDKH